ncbi:hypothetical protein Aduo_018124 [Ancylostoma duodenale]
MRQCREDSRSLRDNLNDVQATIETLRKQGEVVDTTHMLSMVLDTFCKRVQEEVIKKEFDSNKEWNMSELLENLSVVVRRREHLKSRKEHDNIEEVSVFHTRSYGALKCTGCGRNHTFQNCTQYRTIDEKIERLKPLSACWKCFSPTHRSNACRKRNYAVCNGNHSETICDEGRHLQQLLSSIDLEDETASLRKEGMDRTNIFTAPFEEVTSLPYSNKF